MRTRTSLRGRRVWAPKNVKEGSKNEPVIKEDSQKGPVTKLGRLITIPNVDANGIDADNVDIQKLKRHATFVNEIVFEKRYKYVDETHIVNKYGKLIAVCDLTDLTPMVAKIAVGSRRTRSSTSKDEVGTSGRQTSEVRRSNADESSVPGSSKKAKKRLFTDQVSDPPPDYEAFVHGLSDLASGSEYFDLKGSERLSFKHLSLDKSMAALVDDVQKKYTANEAMRQTVSGIGRQPEISVDDLNSIKEYIKGLLEENIASKKLLAVLLRERAGITVNDDEDI